MSHAEWAAPPEVELVIWDLTYACPLRCTHCMTESGRRPGRVLDRDAMLTVLDAILSARPKRVAISGGEPMLVKWWPEAAAALANAGIAVRMFTSGWVLDDAAAYQLAAAGISVGVSVDGPDEATHDSVRGRQGGFRRALKALETLERVNQVHGSSKEAAVPFGVEYTVTRSGMHDLEAFVEHVSRRFRSLGWIRFGAAVPVGLAQERGFVERELLDPTELRALSDAGPRLRACARAGVAVSVTDVRHFLPGSPLSGETAGIAHIEPDGEMRAFTNYEAKVGNVRDEPIDVLWARAHEWRQDPFVQKQLSAIDTPKAWARVTRTLDRRYGSAADRNRLARRGESGAVRV